MKCFKQMKSHVDEFLRAGGIGPDPMAKIFEERRKEYSLFTTQLNDSEIEALRDYIFCYKKLPMAAGDAPVPITNLIAGEWRKAQASVSMTSPGDKRITLAEVPDSQKADVDAACAYAFDYWKTLKWSEETLAYRKHVMKNFSRILNYFYEDCLKEIRVQIPKTRFEADKDFWEAKRAVDHLEGSAERAMAGDVFPQMIEGHSYWKNSYIAAGVSAIFAPMNFIYGIPVIHLAGCYLTGSPLIFKGHPFAAITNTTLMRMMLAAGAEPHSIQKIEGFGKGVESLVNDPRIAVVSLTGSDATAERMQSLRGLRPTKFEGGGCNWSYVDEGFSDEDLNKIAVRLAYSKLGFSSHKCTTLHGIAGPAQVLNKVMTAVSREMDQWKIENPLQHLGSENDNAITKVVGPCMVHKAQTATEIQEAAAKAGATVLRKGGKVGTGAYGENAEVIAPIILTNVKPGMKITVDWDGKGEKTFDPTNTEFFMPILLGMEMKSMDDFINFCLFHNHHDLAVSMWSRNDKNLFRARRVLAGMLKENDGTDSALEWEEFGASGVGTSGNMGVGDPEATFSIYCRRQKGRHIVF